ncbi:hypothetical protein BCR34DRAFT_493763 [Clohesyomyces aquaticus]|uniref:LysM domain-containing protein n=1 Tax=Clohesyomyces aquaticus TaxID=1231657 RepID=A0A1Y1YV14_9PLEO|nr:hypothetical protein BCR34DRAFT_493763 [Clohesyomyces aquaticus]
MTNGSDIWTYKYAEGSRMDCEIYTNGTQFGDNASCADVSKGYGVTVQNLTLESVLLTSNCALDGKLTYCVEQTRINATKFTQYCTFADSPDYGFTCPEFLAAWGIDLEEFSAWNPGVGSNCENWLLGKSHLQLFIPHFRQPGIVSTCNQFAMANVSAPVLDPCGIIETKFGLQHGRFVAWIPALGVNCKFVHL